MLSPHGKQNDRLEKPVLLRTPSTGAETPRQTLRDPIEPSEDEAGESENRRGERGRYLGAAVQRGLPAGAAAQHTDGDVRQLLPAAPPPALAAPDRRWAPGPSPRHPRTRSQSPQ